MARKRFWEWSSQSRRRSLRGGSPRRATPGLEELETRTVPAANLHLTNAYFVDANNNPITAPTLGEMTFIRVEWSSTDLADGQEYIVRILLDGVPVESTTMVGRPGVDLTCTCNVGGWYASPGEHHIFVALDARGAIAETNESDNFSLFSFSPTAPATLPVKFTSPLGGVPGRDWVIVNYTDVDPRPGQARDFEGGPYQYDGHDGIDFSLPNFAGMDAGLPVYAAAGGRVIQIEDGHFDRETSFNTRPENFVVIDHGNGWETVYAHLARNSITVKFGDIVGAGQMIGLVGSSGNSTGPHLHFGIRHNGAPVEPGYAPAAYFLDPAPYQNDQPTTVLDSGIANYSVWNDFNERPSGISVFPTTKPWDVWYWYRLSHLPADTPTQINWYRPDGTLERTVHYKSTSIERFGPYAWSLPPSAWNNHAGTWNVALVVNGVEKDRQSFEVTAAAGVPEIRLSQGTTYVLDGRTTPLDFGNVPSGGVAPQRTFTIENHGSTELTTANLFLPQGFSLVGNFPASIAAGATASFTLQLDANKLGPRFGEVRFETNDSDESVFTFNVRGTVTGNPLSGTPSIMLPGPAVFYDAGGEPVPIAPLATLADADSPNFNTGNLTVALASGGTIDDRLGVRHQGSSSGQIGVGGTAVTFAGTLIGTLAGGVGLTPLIVALNGNATLAAVQALIRNITFATTSITASTAPRYASFSVVDNTGKPSTEAVKTILTLPTTPTLSGISDQTSHEDMPSDPITFLVGDQETPLTSLVLRGESSDPSMVPNGNIVFSGTGANRQVIVTPAVNMSGLVTITVFVTDSNNASASQSFLLTILPVNDAPEFSIPTIIGTEENSGPVTAPGFASPISPGAPDEGDQELVFEVTVLGTTGNLSFLSAPSLTSNGTLTFTAQDGTLGLATVQVVLRDNGGTDNGGANTSSPRTFAIYVGDINNAPTFTLAGDPAVNEDAGVVTVSGFADNISPGPADESNQELTFLVSVISTTGGLTFDIPPTIDPLTGDLIFKTTANANGSATVEVRLRDNGGMENGGQDTSAPQTFQITVNAVNDPPTLTAPGPVSLFEDTVAVIESIQVTNDSTGEIQIRFHVGHGTLRLRTDVVNGLTASDVVDNGTEWVTVTATPARINATLAAASGLTYLGVRDYYGADQLQIDVDDLGESGGGNLTVSATVNLAIAPINDVPIVVLPETQGTAWNTSKTFGQNLGNVILVDDVEATLLRVTVMVSPGRLTLGTTVGLIDLQGNGSERLVLIGSPAAITAALDGLVFTPPRGFIGQAALTVIAEDRGETGLGGPMLGMNMIAIYVAAPAPEVVNELWAIQVYQDLLDRSPNSSELASLTSSLARGVSRTELARQITRTTEYQTRAIQKLHHRLVNRLPGDAELNRYLGLLQRGATYQYVAATIMGRVRSQKGFLNVFAVEMTGGRLTRKQKVRLKKTSDRPGEVTRLMKSTEWVQQFVRNLIERYLRRSAVGDELFEYSDRMELGRSDTATPKSLEVLRGVREEQIIADLVGSKTYLDRLLTS